MVKKNYLSCLKDKYCGKPQFNELRIFITLAFLK